MNIWTDFHSDIISVIACLISLGGGWYLGARYSDWCAMRREYNAAAYRIRRELHLGLKDGIVSDIRFVDEDNFMHLASKSTKAAYKKARAEYQKARSEEAQTLPNGRRCFRDKSRVTKAVANWFDVVELR